MEEILKYFTDLSSEQFKQLSELDKLYKDWNSKINVISRKDIDNLYLHHVLHSLSIFAFISFKDGTKILDVGTGGGFPGIPLAIMLPSCKFKLIDRTAKKIKVATEIATAIGLKNVIIEQKTCEDEKDKYDFVVSRAVMDLKSLVSLCKKNVLKISNNAIPNGLICLKGGDIQGELKPYRKIAMVENLKDYFNEEWFKTKSIVYVPF